MNEEKEKPMQDQQQTFTVKGFEIIQKKVIHYPTAASRVLVPKHWKETAIIRTK